MKKTKDCIKFLRYQMYIRLIKMKYTKIKKYLSLSLEEEVITILNFQKS